MFVLVSFSYFHNIDRNELYIKDLIENDVKIVRVYSINSYIDSSVKGVYPLSHAMHYDPSTNIAYADITYRDSYDLVLGRLPQEKNEFLITSYKADEFNMNYTDIIGHEFNSIKIVGIINMPYSTKGNDNSKYYYNYLDTNGLASLYSTKELYYKSEYITKGYDGYLNTSEYGDINKIFDDFYVTSEIDYEYDRAFNVVKNLFKNPEKIVGLNVGLISRITFYVASSIFIYSYFILFTKRKKNVFSFLKNNGIKERNIYGMFIVNPILELIISTIASFALFFIVYNIANNCCFKYNQILTLDYLFDYKMIIVGIIVALILVSIRPLEVLFKKN